MLLSVYLLEWYCIFFLFKIKLFLDCFSNLELKSCDFNFILFLKKNSLVGARPNRGSQAQLG
jgi:hypothetical protein